MEEPELRVGGWEKQRKRGLIRRLFYFCLVITVAFLVGGPQLVNHKSVEVTSNSIIYNAGVWNGPFDIKETNEFNGHLKISSSTYESTDAESGTLTIISMRSFFDLNQLPISVTNLIVEKVDTQAQEEGLKLIGTGYISNEKNDKLPQNTITFQWTAEKETSPSKVGGFFENLEESKQVEVRAFYWSKPVTTAEYINYQTMICVLFGTDQNTINQGMDLVENIR